MRKHLQILALVGMLCVTWSSRAQVTVRDADGLLSTRFVQSDDGSLEANRYIARLNAVKARQGATPRSSTGTSCTMALPYACDFEAANDLSCWTVVSNQSGTGVVYGSIGMNGTGGNIFHFEPDPNNVRQLLISPELSGTSSGVQMTFIFSSQSTADFFKVGYSTTDANESSFTWLSQEYYGSGPSNLQYFAEQFPAGTKYLAIRYAPDFQYGFNVDNFLFEEPSACYQVTHISHSYDYSRTRITWRDNDNVGATYTIYDMSDNSVIASGVTGWYYDVTGLAASTSYVFGVQANCSATSSSEIVTTSYTTMCDPVGLPFVDGFGTDDNPHMYCWMYTKGNMNNFMNHETYGGRTVWTFSSEYPAQEGSNSYYQTAFSPLVSIPADTASATMRVIFSTYGSSDPLYFGWTDSITSLESLYSWSGPYYTNGYDDWDTVEVAVPANTVRVAIRYAATRQSQKAMLDRLEIFVGDGSGLVEDPVVGEADPVTPPYSTGFESGEDVAWSTANGSNGWYIGSATSNGSSRSLYISDDDGLSNNYITSGAVSSSYAYRKINLQATQYTISYDWVCNGEGQYDFLRVFLAPASATFTADQTDYIEYNSTPVGWIALDGGSCLSGSAYWQTKTASFTPTAAGTYYMVYYWCNDYSVGSQTPAAVDNISVVASQSSGGEEPDTNTHTVTAADLPYSTGFERGDDVEWTLANDVNGWGVGSAVSNSGNRSIYVSNDNGVSNEYSMSSASHSYAYKLFNFENTEYAFSFDWKCNGESSYDFLRVFLVPASATLNAGQSNSISTSGAPEGWMAIDGGSHLSGSSSWQTVSVTITPASAGQYYVVFYWRNDNSMGSQPPAAVDNVSINPNRCPAPTNLTANVTESGMTLSWTPGGTETEWRVVVDVLQSYEVTTPALLLTDLASATEHDFQVFAVCGDSSVSNPLHGAFSTACIPLVIDVDNPFIEGFEGETFPPSDCWENYHADGPGSYLWDRNTSASYSHSGIGSAKINDMRATTLTNLVTPPIAINASDSNGYTVSFWMYRNATGTTNANEGVRVWASHNNSTDGATLLAHAHRYTGFEPVVSSTGWYEYEATIPITGVVYIIFEGVCEYGASSYIDDITIYKMSPCAKPDNVHTTSLTSDAVTIDWNQNSTQATESGWQVMFGPSPLNIETADIITLNNHIFNANNLLSATNYDFYVRANCGDDGTSLWSQLYTFLTPCSDVTVTLDNPYIYGFEDATGSGSSHSISPCWIKGTNATTQYPYPTTSYTSNNSNPLTATNRYCLVFYATTTNYSYAVLPPFTNAINTLQLSLKAYRSSTNATYGVLNIGYLTDTNDIATFQLVQQIRPNEQSTWETFTIPFYAVDAANARIAIMTPTEGYNYVYVDDIEVALIPSCTPVTDLTMTEVSANSIGLAWNDNHEGVVYTVNVYNGDTLLSTLTSQLTTLTVAGLDPATTYTFKVKVNCTDGSTSPYTTVTTRTISASASLPYATGFEPNDDQGWDFFNSTNGWAIGSATNYTGSNALYVSNDNGATNAYTINSTSTSFAYRTLLFPQAGDYMVSFDWKGQGENNYDYMNVWLVPATYQFTAGTTPVVGNDWITLVEKKSGVSSWLTVQQVITLAAGGNYNLVFMWRNDSGGGTLPPAAVDNVSVAPLSCSSPVNLTVDATTTYSATISWQNTGESDFTVVRLGDEGGWLTVTDSSYTFVGLSAGTAYTAYIATLCNGDTSLAVTTSFLTACGAVATPYTTSFEDANSTEVPYCWTKVGSGTLNVVTGNANSGSKALRFSGSTSNLVLLPENQADINTLQLRFWSRPESITNAYCGTFSVGYAVDTMFVELANFAYNEWSSLAYEERTVGFADAPLGARMAMRHNAVGTGWFWFVDDVTVEIDNTCYPVTTEIEVSADGSYMWNGDEYYASGDYYTYYMAANGCDSIVILHLTINYDSTNVTYANSCDVYVWNIYGDSIAYSESYYKSGTYFFGNQVLVLTINYSQYTDTFVTALESFTWHGVTYTESGTYNWIGTTPEGCDDVAVLYLTINASSDTVVTPGGTSVPYATGFELTDDNSWLYANNSNGWTIGSAVNNGGNRALYISSDGVNNTYSVNNTSSSYFYKTFNLQAVEHDVAFDWKGIGEGTWDYMRVFAVPASVNFIAGNTGGIAATGAPEGWIALDGGNTLSGSTDWSRVEATFTPEVAGAYNIVFYWRNDGSVGTQPPAAVDNFIIAPVSCVQPAALAASNVTSDGFTLNWSAGSADDNAWVVSVNGANVTVNATNFTVTGLNAATSYTVKVATLCPDGSLSRYATLSVTTLCGDEIENDTTVAEACGRFAFNGRAYSESGVYVDSVLTPSGCMSLSTLILTIHPSYSTTLTETAVGSYTWKGTTYTASGTYYDVNNTVYGCDSTEILDLTLMIDLACDSGNAVTVSNSETSTATSQYIPGYSYYNYSYSEVIIPAEQLAGIGTVKALQFKPAATNGGNRFSNCEIYLANTDAANLSSGFIQDAENFQLVFSGDMNYTTTDWQTVAFSNHFEWDGYSNIVVAVRRNDGSYTNGSSFASYTDSALLARYIYRDNDPFTIGSIQNGTATSTIPLYRLLGCESNGIYCPRVSNITVSDITATSATITWSPGSSDDATWVVILGEDTVIVTDTFYVLTNLQEQTDYTVQVATNCSDATSAPRSLYLSTMPSCMPPTDLEMNNVTAHGATMSWVSDADSYTIVQYVVNSSNYTVVATGVTANSYEITGLEANTIYGFGVMAHCGDAQSEIPTFTFRTLCESGNCNIYIAGVDSYGDGWNGASITVMQNDATLGTFTVSGSGARGTFDVCAASPISFSWVAGSFDGECSFDILNENDGIVYSVSDASSLFNGQMFFIMDSCNMEPLVDTTVVEQHDTLVFSEVACDSYEWNGEIYTQSGIYVHEDSASVIILDLTINYGVNTVDSVEAEGSFSWNGMTYTESGYYTYNYTDINGCNSTATLILIINGGDTIEDNPEPTCLPILIGGENSYSENFNSVTSGVPECWTKTEGWNYYANGYEGGCIRFNGSFDTLTTPTFTISENSWLTFSYKRTQGCHFSLWYSADGGNTFDNILAAGVGEDDWTEQTLYLEPAIFTGHDVVFFFQGVNENNNGEAAYVYLDNFAIYPAPEEVCISPTLLTINDLTAHSVTLSWVSSADSFDVVLFPDTASNEYITLATGITDTFYNVDNMNANTIYGLGVIAHCGTMESEMPTFTFRTLCETGNCNIFLVGNDSGADGWNNAYITVEQFGNIVRTFDVDGRYGNGSWGPTDVCAGVPITFTWTSGTNDSECGFSILNSNEETVYSVSNASSLFNGQMFFVMDSCNMEQFGDTTIVEHHDTLLFSEVACDSYEWNGMIYTQSGIYYYEDSASIIVMDLTVNYSSTSTETATSCDEYYWNNEFYNVSGAYTFQTWNAAGCDSTVTLNLTVNNSVNTSFSATACDSYMWDGDAYNATGSYVKTYIAANGCDSIVTLNLTINASGTQEETVVACDNYTWNGTVYTASGLYEYTHNGENGCQIVATLNLTVNYSSTSTETATACDEYYWNNEFYNVSGAYTFQTWNAAGCDSTVTLNLTVNYNTNNAETQTVCDSIIWNGQTYTYGDVFTYEYIAANGCPSVETLYLTVNYSNGSEENEYVCDGYSWNGGYYAQSGVYTAVFTNEVGCDSTATLNLTVNYSSTSTETATACDEYYWNNEFYNVSGAYTFQTWNAAGCDSTVTLNLTVIYNTNNAETQTVCDSIIWNGQTYTYGDVFTYEYIAANGCPSVDTLYLTVNYSNGSEENEYVCDGYSWNGGYYAQSGVYTAVFTNEVGCDSTATLNLTVNYSSTSTDTATACDEYYWNNEFYNVSGSYTFHTWNAAGCDSTVTLNLTVNYNTNSAETMTVCDSYIWNGELYTYSGEFTHRYYAANGCVSVDTLYLTVNYSNGTTEDVNVCDSYMWNGVTYSNSGMYTYTAINEFGCDSTVTLNLTVNNSVNTSFSATACDSYMWDGDAYNATGSYVKTYIAANGCDSIVTLNLTINASGIQEETVVACDNYTWNGTVYTASGLYEYTHNGENGCQIVATLNLTINNSTSDVVYETACDGYVSWSGEYLTNSSTYTYQTLNVAGCDSIVTLNLTINGSSSSVENVTACDSYLWNDITYTYSGEFNYQTTNANGCDSMVTLLLTVNYSNGSEENEYVCDGYSWNGGYYAQSGVYTAVFTNEVGCDSTATLNLTVNYSTTSEEVATACEYYYWNDQYYTESGVYTYTTLNDEGCTHTATLNLTINNNTNSVETITACDGYMWNGELRTVSGDYTYDYSSTDGCPSVDTLHLTINYSSATNEEATACDSYIWNDNVYTVGDVYTYSTTNVFGCDSTVTLYLTLHVSTSAVLSQTACDSYLWNDQYYTESGVYTYQTTNANGCDSTATLYLTVNNNTSNASTLTVCDSYVWHGNTYAESGDYTYNYNSASGCPSVDTLHLTVLYNTNSMETVTACDSYTWNDNTYTNSGTYHYSYFADNGCASVDTLILTVNNSYNTSFSSISCDSYTWNDEVYTATGAYTHTYIAANGCDSIVTMNLTINNSGTVVESATACDSYTWNGTTFTASGTYEYPYIGTNECQVMAVLNLTINYSSNVIEEITACESYTWNGITYPVSTNTPTYTTVGTNGCDSTTTLNLTINHATSVTEVLTACDSYTWNGTVYTASVDNVSYTTVGTNGCDSTTTLHLTINYSNTSSETASACNAYTWHDVAYTSSTSTATYTTTNAAGCDSTITLNLTIHYGNHSTEVVNACDSYTWHGTTYTASTTNSNRPTFTGTNVFGCDSTVALYLTVRYSNTGSETATACDSYMWKGERRTESGEYTYVSSNSVGCDSIITLTLNLNRSTTAIETAVACESYTWHGETYTSSTATPTYTTMNSVGCDSTVTLNLTINYANTGIENVSACDSYFWHGNVYNQSGEYTYQTTNAAGCDSIVTLNLTLGYASNGVEAVTACDSYTWHGTTYNASTVTPTHTTTNAAGCDSTVTLNLTIINSTTSTEPVTACDRYLWHGTTYTASNNTATFTTTAANGCDSIVTLNLTLNHSTAGIENVTACDSYTWHGTTYTSSYNNASYTTTNAAGCDSIVTLHLTINYSTTGTETATACGSLFWHGVNYTASTDSAIYTTIGANGCDSTVTLHLTINNGENTVEAVSACDNYTWHGTTYNASTTSPTYTTTDVNGCDSTVTLNLTMGYSNSSVETITACNSYVWHGTEYSASTDAPTFVTTNASGCDSTVSLHLTITHCSTTEIVTCDSYSWHGTTYNTSGEYIDGTDTLLLTVNYSTSSTLSASACDSYSWHGNVYIQSGEYTYQTTNAAGCDSVVSLNLNIRHSSSSVDNVVACDRYTWHGLSFASSTSGINFTTTNAAGCDSTVTLDLTILYSTAGTESVTACDRYTWHGLTFTASNHNATYMTTAANGCDSMVTLDLTVRYSSMGDTSASVCGIFDWYENTDITTSQNINHTFVSGNRYGCDSTVTLHLTINHCSTTEVTACESYLWHNNTYTTSGIYNDGYDTLILTINRSTTGDTFAVVCSSFDWYDYTDLTTSQSLSHTFAGANAAGCDSTVTLHLTINHCSTTEVTACDSYTWGGGTFTSSGTYIMGTDTLILTINHSTTGDTVASACGSFGWYEYDDLTASQDVVHTFTEGNTVGCDSIVTLHLTVKQCSITTVTSCDNYTWHGNTFTSSGVYPDGDDTLILTINRSTTGDTMALSYTDFSWYEYTEMSSTQSVSHIFSGANRFGCDSTVTLHLLVARTENKSSSCDTVVACDRYNWHGFTLTSSGLYPLGSDTLLLTIKHSNTGDTVARSCDSFDWYEHTDLATSQSVFHTFAGANAEGCDSIVKLHLTINNCSTTEIATCDSYTWHGNTFTSSGVYHDGYETLILSINRRTTGDTSAVECGSFSWYEYSDITASRNVNHTFVAGNRYGCDSTVTLHLTINHCSSNEVTACDSYNWHGYNITSSGTYRDGYDTLHLTINRSTTGDTAAVACGSYDWYEHTDLTTSQNVSHLFVGGSANGCNKTVTLHLTVNQCSTTEVTTCGSYLWNGNTYTSSGTYNVGTDTLILTINHATTSDTIATACDSYSWYEHTDMTTSRDVTHTFNAANAAGCDSTVTLHLTVNQCSTTPVTACDSYLWHGNTYTQSGTYNDGTDTLVLTINYSTMGVEPATACDSYLWHGTTYTASNNTATFTTANAAGCDSTVTLNLTINYSTTGVDSATACDSYLWHGTTYTASNNTATFTTTNAAGCDSTVTLNLTVNYSTTGVDLATACDSYTWHGTTYTASNNTATFTTTNAAGCDSTVTLNLTVNYSTTSVETATACDSYLWHGTTYTASNNTATFTTTNAAGCDSTVTLNLTINYSVEETVSETVTGSYTWHGTTYTQSGVYTWTGTTTAGCDSTVTLNLTVRTNGIDDIDGVEVTVTLYPNPTTGWINIDADDVQKVEVYDVYGRRVATHNATNRIDLHGLAAGTYTLRVDLLRGTAVQRVILR